MPTQPSQFEVLLVVGIDALGLARLPYLLHKAGCRVTLLAPSRFTVTRSRHVCSHLPTTAEPNALALHLKEVLSAQRRPFAMVIIGDEPTLIAVAEHRGEAWLDGWFPVDHRTKAVDEILSKVAFHQAVVSAGLPMPYSKLCQGWVEVQAVVERAGYPVMLKAAQGLSGSGVHKVLDSGELEPAYVDLAPMNESLLVQHFCEGALGSTDVLFDHGVPVCWQSSYSLQCWPTPLASSSAREMMQHPDIEQILLKVGQITGFHGFAGVDWIHEKSPDHISLLELNPRPTPAYHLDQYSGVSFSRSLNRLLSGRCNITPPKLITQPTRLIRLFPQGLYWAISNRDWRSFIMCWNDAICHDPRLMLSYLRRVLTHFMPKQWLLKVKPYLRG